jgi:hypothetical protein
MKPGGRQPKAVVFYCDEGVKGFSALDGDPMKEEKSVTWCCAHSVRLSGAFDLRWENQDQQGMGGKVSGVSDGTLSKVSLIENRNGCY